MLLGVYQCESSLRKQDRSYMQKRKVCLGDTNVIFFSQNKMTHCMQERKGVLGLTTTKSHFDDFSQSYKSLRRISN